MIGELLALLGALLVLISAVGVVRFDDVLARLHALAKASTLGVLLILAGAAVNLRDLNDVTSVALAGRPAPARLATGVEHGQPGGVHCRRRARRSGRRARTRRVRRHEGGPIMTATGVQHWPSIPVDEWEATRDTLHLYTQVVGKVRMTNEPLLNHWWNTTLYLTARGLTTSLMPHPTGPRSRSTSTSWNTVSLF